MTSKEITRREDPPLVKLLDQFEGDLTEALPTDMTPGRFKSICVNQLRQNPQLTNVEPITFISSVLLSAQLGLEPGAPMGLAWIIPRRNKGRLEASLQLGYQGLRQLAYRSGQVKQVGAFIVNEGDDFDYRYEVPAGWVLDWTPGGIPDRDWTHVFATAETVLGGVLVEVMTKEEVYAHRDRYVSDWKKSTGWTKNEPEMARKTVLAKLCRQLPMSSEFRNAMVADGSSPREVAPDLAGLTALEAAEVEEVESE